MGEAAAGARAACWTCWTGTSLGCKVHDVCWPGCISRWLGSLTWGTCVWAHMVCLFATCGLRGCCSVRAGWAGSGQGWVLSPACVQAPAAGGGLTPPPSLPVAPSCKHTPTTANRANTCRHPCADPRPRTCARHADNAGQRARGVGEAQQHGRVPRRQVSVVAVQPRQGEAGQAQRQADQACGVAAGAAGAAWQPCG